MKLTEAGALKKALEKNKFVLLVLCLGLLLLLLPRRTSAPGAAAVPADAGDPLKASGIPLDRECVRLAALLSGIRGVGAAEVLLSANGCVVVCDGADSAEVRWNVTDAVSAYTGLGSDRISVMKMK